MANYQKIMRRLPEVRDFARNRRWVHRGDVVVYGANTSCASFSTDARGFRHSIFDGKTVSVRDCIESERYGLVLGSSNVYGFGLAGNGNTIPSRLAERFGFPFANVGLPEGNSRNLFSLLVGLIARAPRPPAAVVHLSGGDFTSFCYTTIADPVFGSPNLRQGQAAVKERGGRPAPASQIGATLAFTSLWTRAIAELCREQAIPLVLGNDTTFFEKRNPSLLEKECGLGEPFNAAQARQFAAHRAHVMQFYQRRAEVAAAAGVALAGPGPSNDIGFVDEFHYDRAGTQALSDDFAKALEPLL